MEKERLNVNMPTSLMNDIRVLAAQMGLNKTSMVIVALKQYVDQQKGLEAMSNASQLETLINQIKNSGK